VTCAVAGVWRVGAKQNSICVPVRNVSSDWDWAERHRRQVSDEVRVFVKQRDGIVESVMSEVRQDDCCAPMLRRCPPDRGELVGSSETINTVAGMDHDWNTATASGS
jgi:hypothetical protein